MTCHGELTSDEGEVAAADFEKIMRIQLKLYVQRQVRCENGLGFRV